MANRTKKAAQIYNHVNTFKRPTGTIVELLEKAIAEGLSIQDILSDARYLEQETKDVIQNLTSEAEEAKDNADRWFVSLEEAQKELEKLQESTPDYEPFALAADYLLQYADTELERKWEECYKRAEYALRKGHDHPSRIG